MAYSQHEWTNGEIITAEKLNNMEQGIAETDTREINASATASVENTIGTPSVDVEATGSVSSIAFSFAFKGIKGETGEQGETGTTPLLQKGDSAIQVSYDSGDEWQDLIQLDDIKGEQGEKGDKGDKGDTGEGFSVYKTYASIDEMTSDADNVEEGKFVLIASDVEDEDNAKLYVKGADSFTFLTDLSGAQGIKGEQGDTGKDGVTPKLQKADTAIQVSYDEGSNWTDLVALEDIKGEKGNTGDAAGFGTPTASASSLESSESPAVSVTASGEDSAKVFAFSFGIPKGEQGAAGTAAGFGTPTASATALDASSSPTVSVEASGEDTAKVFAFAFGIPKGETGATGAQGTAAGFGTPTATATSLAPTESPTVSVTASGEDTAKVFAFAFGIPKGEDGVTPKFQKTGTAIQVSYDNGESWADLVQLADIEGEQGEAAPTITSCTINISGSTVSGSLGLSTGGSVDITGTYTAESGE